MSSLFFFYHVSLRARASYLVGQPRENSASGERIGAVAGERRALLSPAPAPMLSPLIIPVTLFSLFSLNFFFLYCDSFFFPITCLFYRLFFFPVTLFLVTPVIPLHFEFPHREKYNVV